MSFIDDIRKIVGEAVTAQFAHEQNAHAVIYKDAVIIAGFEGVYTVTVEAVTFKKATVNPTAYGAMLEPHHGDMLVFDRMSGWHLARRDGVYHHVKDSDYRNVDNVEHSVEAPPPPTAPVFSSSALDDDIPF